MPEVEEPEEVEISQNDLRIDYFRSSGPGGQSVNTTDSAVRITHEPTGIVVSMQNEKSQLQNREAAMRVLRSRLLAHQQEQIDAENAQARKSQVRTMDRSERIRTYNFPENRIADHRTGYKAYNLDSVINGDLEAVVQSCIQLDEAERLASWRTMRTELEQRLKNAAAELAEAGVPTPRVDAELLASHVLNLSRERCRSKRWWAWSWTTARLANFSV